MRRRRNHKGVHDEAAREHPLNRMVNMLVRLIGERLSGQRLQQWQVQFLRDNMLNPQLWQFAGNRILNAFGDRTFTQIAFAFRDDLTRQVLTTLAEWAQRVMDGNFDFGIEMQEEQHFPPDDIEAQRDRNQRPAPPPATIPPPELEEPFVFYPVPGLNPMDNPYNMPVPLPTRAPGTLAPDGTVTAIPETDAPTGPPQPVMSKFTSFPNTHCCVDLGYVDLSPHTRGGRRGSRTSKELLPATVFQFQRSQLALSAKDAYSVTFPSDIRVDRPDTALIKGTLTSTGSRAHVKFLQSPQTAMNAVWQIENAFAQTSNNVTLHEGPYAKPIYAPTSDARNFITDAQDGSMNIFLSRQSACVLMKNVTANAASDSSISQSPCFVRMLWIQAKHNIHQSVSTTSEADFLANKYINGMDDYFSTFNTGIKYTPSLDRSLGTSFKDSNFWDDWSIVETKEFCLAPGQQAQVKYGIKSPQILSTKYTFDSVPGQFHLSNQVYRPVVAKEGEIHLMMITHGGLAEYTDATAPEVAALVEPTKLLFNLSTSYASRLMISDDSRETKKAQVIPNTAGVLQPDLDIHPSD